LQPFRKLRGVLATLDRANVDTDQIIPKQFLKSIRRTGFGEGLFFDWRYFPDGTPNPEFLINRERFRNADILVTRGNFGCGSSREHAVWAVMQGGFRVVIAPEGCHGEVPVPAFADIFRNNATKNGLLCVALGELEVDRIFELVERFPGLQATVDLEKQCIVLHGEEAVPFPFEIESAVREYLLDGRDEIALTLEHEADIARHEGEEHPRARSLRRNVTETTGGPMQQYTSDDAHATGPDTGSSPGLCVFNREELLERLGDDEELVAEIVELFLDDAPQQIASIEAAVAAKDGEEIRNRAHALKGAAANMGAADLCEKARQMEMAAEGGRSDEAVGLLDAVRESFARLREALTTQ
jgi:3-isopropylmalate/(R)-2-methylmalate dehydratase small subunit